MRISDWSSDVCSSDLTIIADMPFPKNVASGQSRKIIARTQLLAINFIPFVLAQIADDDSGAPLPWLHPGCRPEAIVLRSEAKPPRSWFSRPDRLGQSLAHLGSLPGWPKKTGTATGRE